MARQEFLKSKKVKELRAKLEGQWGFTGKLDYQFLSNDSGKIWIVNKDVAEIDLESVRLNSIGLYFGELVRGELRLSIEGSQIIGPCASKNVIGLDSGQANSWLMGEDVSIDTEGQGFMIVRSGNDYMGTGKTKDGRLLNYVPKIRRLKATHQDSSLA